MDPRDDRTSFIRAEFKNFLNTDLKSRHLSPVQQPPTLPSVASVLNDNLSSALTPRSPQDAGSPSPSGPQLPPLNFSAIDAPTTTTPNSVQAQERSFPSIMQRKSTVTNHDRALSFVVPSATNKLATEKNGEEQPSLDMKVQSVIPLESNATPSSSDNRGPPTPISTSTPTSTTPTPTPTPSMSMADIKLTKIETRPEPPSLTLNITPTNNLLMHSHHSPTTTILTNPHHSPTQSLLTNPYHGSDSPSTINLNHSPFPLHDLDNISPPAHSSPPISHTGSDATVPSPANSEASTSTRSQTGLRSPLRSSFYNVPDLSTATSADSSLAVNLTPPSPGALPENTRTKTQDIIANQSIKDESVNDQYQTTLSKYHNGLLPTSTTSSQQPSIESQRDDTSTKEVGILYPQQSERPSMIDNEKDALRRQPTQQQNPRTNTNNDETGTSAQSQAKNTRSGSVDPLVIAVKPTGDMDIDSSVQRTSTSSTDSSGKSSVNPSTSSRAVGRLSPTRSGLGRKPSGARAQLAPRSYIRNGPESFPSPTLTEEEEEDMSEPQKQDSQATLAYDDANAEALAALTYLDIADSEDVSTSPLPSHHRSPITSPSAEPPISQLLDRPVPPTMLNSDSMQFRSSFAPSSKVAERMQKALAQQAAHEAAKHRPGRANGKKAKTTAGAWESSEEEDEDEDDDEDEDVDSDPEVPMRGPQSASSRLSSSSSARPPQSQHGASDSNDGPPSHLRPPRHLPPVPPGRSGKCRNSAVCICEKSCSNHFVDLYSRGRTLSAAKSPDDC